ncbi:MAG TPA: pitrilysin family protein [Ferruginibacter sp.]|nr:pitrilysin family protein [Ferruginibacter sp.]
MRIKIFAAAVMLLITANNIFSQARLVEKVAKKPGEEIIIPYEKFVLPNGLTVIVHEDHSDPVVYVDVTYHVGSAREEIGKSGFAHFFEHMMFEGSDHVGKGAHFKIVTDAGGTLNGSTNQDRTNYYETVPSNQLEKMIWLEADRMGYLLDAVTQEKFDNQRSTVKNERGQNYDNRPYGLTGEFASKNLYPYGHPYSWLTIGYVEDLNRVELNDLKNFFLRWYGPNNATLTVAGDVKTSEVLKMAEKYFSSIPKGPAVEKTVLPKVHVDADRYVSFTDNYARIPQLTKVYPTVPDYDKDMAALACLAQVLGQGRNSILYQQLVKPKKALSASAFSSLSELAGEFTFRITPYPGKSLADMDALLKEAITSFETRGVTDKDIMKFKGGIEAQYVNQLQSVQGKGARLAAFQTITGNPNMIGKLLNMYRSVTKEDVWRVYNEYIKGKHSVTVSVLTKGQEKDKMIAAPDNYMVDATGYQKPNYGYEGLHYVKGKDIFERSKVPGNGPNPVVKVPPFWKKELPNGIKMIGTQNTEIPTVTLSFSIPGGHLAQANDTSRIGLADMVASMLNEDTKNYTAEQMSVELQKLGSSISVSSDLNSMNFTVQTLKKNVDKTLALLEERMLRPNFTEESFDRIQKQSLEGFKQAKSQPATIATQVYNKLNYGPYHIFGMSESGTEHTIRNLKLKDIQQYYDNYMTSQDTKVVVVGDITQSEIEPKLNFLNKLPNKKINLPKPGPISPVTKTRLYLVDIPKGAQTEFRVGYLTGLKYDATGEYYKSGLMNYVLGGSFNSHLNMNLREEKGWTYGARSSFSSNEYNGTYTFSSGIRADATDSALVEAMKDIKHYAEHGITDEELVFTKNAIGQRDALLYETGTQKAGFIRRILDYNLPGNFAEQQNKILASMTKKELNALSKKWLVTDKMNILLVGDKAKILPGLQKLGYEIIELDVDGNKKDPHFK